MNIKDLTRGERVLLQRRRAGQSQRDAAEGHKVSLYCYRRWEVDEDETPEVVLNNLLGFEACFFRRRRAGMSLKFLAEAMRVSRWWLCQMEHGRATTDQLIKYWDGVNRPWRPTAQKVNA